MIVHVEAAAEREQRPHEGQRQRDQRPGELVSIGLQFVEEQSRVRDRLIQAVIDGGNPGIGLRARRETGAGRDLLHRIGEDGRAGRALLAGQAARHAQIVGAFLERVAFALQLPPFGGGQALVREARLDPFDLVLQARTDRVGARLFGGRARDLFADAAARADHRQHRIGQEDREQEQRERRDEARALAVDIAARQVARPPGEQRQRIPQLALEMKDGVDEVVPDRAEAAVDVGLLPATVAMRPDERRAAIEAARAFVTAACAAVPRLDRAARQPRRHRRPDAFDIPAHRAFVAAQAGGATGLSPPRQSVIGAAR